MQKGKDMILLVLTQGCYLTTKTQHKGTLLSFGVVKIITRVLLTVLSCIFLGFNIYLEYYMVGSWLAAFSSLLLSLGCPYVKTFYITKKDRF